MTNDIVSEIMNHLRWRKEIGAPLGQTTFGKRCMNDGHFVRQLRKEGRDIKLSTVNKVRKFIQADRREVEDACKGEVK